MRPLTLSTTLILVLLLALPACGVRFRSSFDGTEVFKGISLSGDRRTEQQLTLKLTVTQGYPVPLHVACYYEEGDRLTDDQLKLAFGERATSIGETVLPAAPDHKPGDNKLDERELSFNFAVHEPGDYFLACLTPAAAENGLGLMFKIR